jgi:hypothetical protein
VDTAKNSPAIPSDKPSAATPDCPLSSQEQTRNLILYGINVTLVYLAAPALYVGIVQAALCDKLGASKTVANLPATMYFWMTPLPVLVAWYFFSVRLLKRVLVWTYLIIAGIDAVVVASLLLTTPDAIIPALLAQGAVLGCALGVVANYQWEVLGRGVSASRRGQALGLAFGVGPIFAFGASLASQLVLTTVAFPWNFASLFAVSVPLMALAAFLSTKFVLPQVAFEPARPSLAEGVFGGLREYFGYRLILLAALATILVASGYNILNNMALYTQEALGEPAEMYAGYQNALRFAFKTGAGLLLGWLLTKSHPKAGLLVTTTFCLASVGWALLVPGKWFLISFGLMGAGELWGVYYPNYILCCSAPSRMRRNMAFTSMLYMPTGFAAYFFGAIADWFGLRTSFVISLVVLGATLLFVQLLLPDRPRPRGADMDASDQTPALETDTKAAALT